MKVRLGLVSNSSSSSFTVFGARLENEAEFEKLTGQDMHEFLANSELDDFYGDPNGWEPEVYVGLCLSGEFEHCQRSDIRDDETPNQFKQRVRDLLPRSIPEDMIGTYSESYYNG